MELGVVVRPIRFRQGIRGKGGAFDRDSEGFDSQECVECIVPFSGENPI